MNARQFMVVAAFCVAPASAQQQSPSPASVAHSGSTQACEPAEPEAGPSGEPIYTSCQIAASGGTKPKLVSSPNEPDLSALHRQGIQGEVVLSLIVGKDSLPRDIVVETSSRSPELDKIAVDLARKSTFSPATSRDGSAIDARARFPTFFWKDSLLGGSLFSKRCQEFVIDAEWHARTWPEEEPAKYRGWLLARGAMVSMLYTQGRVNSLSNAPSYDEVMEKCRRSPNKKFFDVASGGI